MLSCYFFPASESVNLHNKFEEVPCCFALCDGNEDWHLYFGSCENPTVTHHCMTEGHKSSKIRDWSLCLTVSLLSVSFMPDVATEMGWIYAKQGISFESAWINLATLCHLTVSDIDINSLAEFGIQAIVVSRLPRDFVCFCGSPPEILCCFYALVIKSVRK